MEAGVPTDAIDLLRLHEPGRLAALHELDTDEIPPDRQRYSTVGVPTVVKHPGGNDAAFLVATRSLSGAAVEIFHGGFLYPGTAAQIWLRQRDGDSRLLDASVGDCRCLRGAVHVVTLQFRTRIDPDAFLTGGDQSGQSSAPEDAAPPQTRLDGSVLCILADEAERGACSASLAEAGAMVASAHCIGAGRDQLMRSRRALVITDLEFDELGPAEVTKALRDTGYAGQILGLSWTLDDGSEGVDPTGRLQVMPKPVAGLEIVDAAARFVGAATADV
ncbi:MAG: hypothetical protein AAFX05_14450 [Planctomycetota bacterium]